MILDFGVLEGERDTHLHLGLQLATRHAVAALLAWFTRDEFIGYLADLTTKTTGTNIGSSHGDHGSQVVIWWVDFASSDGGNIAPNPAQKGLAAWEVRRRL